VGEGAAAVAQVHARLASQKAGPAQAVEQAEPLRRIN
jgi:hypothetical protein